MKKLLTASVIAISFFAFAPLVLAQSVGPGGPCKQDADCQDANGQSYGCYPEGGGICTVNGDAPTDGTVQPGGTCTNDTSCADVNGQSYGCYQGTCTLNGDAPGSVNAGNTNASTGFVPLAPIPGLDNNLSGSASASNIATFLNNLYKYLIGIAAILAVIQIIRGGLEYATQDSISKHADGKHHIEQALLGLVLVLSPVLVFSLINPSILNLSLNLQPLKTAPGTASSNSGAPGNAPGGGSSGLSPGAISAGGKSLFDGKYMDIVEFGDSTSATNYKCQSDNSTQTKTIFDCSETNTSTGQCSSQYVACITPSLAYIDVSIDPPGLFNATDVPAPGDQAAHDAFSGECKQIETILPGTLGGVTFRDDLSNGSELPATNGGPYPTCPPSDLPQSVASGSAVGCYQSHVYCSI